MPKHPQQPSVPTPTRRVAAPSADSLAAISRAMTVAVQLHHAGKYADAERIYQQVLKLQPDHIDALNSLAMIEFQASRYDSAIARLQRVLAADASNAGYSMNLGAVYDAAGRTAEAKACYMRAIALSPTYADPYYNLGDLHLRERNAEAAITVFDACIKARGRDYHALAYKAHALDDAGQHSAARRLLDFDNYVRSYAFATPQGYADMPSFNTALATHISTHHTLQSGVMSTEHGRHTAELLREPKGPMAAMEARIDEAIRWYIANLPDDATHPAVQWVPKRWKLTSWGVVLFDQGHERAHIHPNGWLSGVFYLSLPAVIDDPARNPEGWLEFGRPSPALRVQSALTIRHYQPRYGTMFLFPSFFYHGTIPFRSDQRRICVAFDVEPIY